MTDQDASQRRRRLVLLSLASGVAWGLIALGLAYTQLHDAVWGGVAAAPVIGLGVGLAACGFAGRPWWVRALHALAALYAAAAAFGLGVGLWDLFVMDIPGRRPLAVVLQSIQAVLWGVTFTGYVLFLWPLSYANHALLVRAGRRRAA